MIALECADGRHLVRLNLLSTLLDEGYAHLHSYLTASVLGRKLFLLPFNRDVQLDAAAARTIMGSLLYCQQASDALRGNKQ
jgi:hypothetical protein